MLTSWLVAIPASFATGVALATAVPALARRFPGGAVRGTLVATSFLGGLAATAAPTGLPVVDMSLRGLAAGAVVACGITAAPLRGGPIVAPLGGLLALVAVQVGLRLGGLGPARLSTLVGLLMVSPFVVAGARQLTALWRKTLLRVGSAAAVAALVASVWAVVAVLESRRELLAAARQSELAVTKARAGDIAGATAGFTGASLSFARAESVLARWPARPGLVVPVASQHLRALGAVASSGRSVSAAAATATALLQPEEARLVNGVVPVAAITALQAPLGRVSSELARAGERLAGARSPWLAAPLERRLEEGLGRLRAAEHRARAAKEMSRVLPAMLGADGPRRYFLAVQTPVELRGTGGIIGNFGEITVDAGRVELTRLGRSADLNRGGDPGSRTLTAPAEYISRYGRFAPHKEWANVTMAPDFPTVARVIEHLYPQSGGQSLDGVISVDPVALAAMLELSGPVTVPGWAEPLSGQNAAQVFLHGHYLRYGGGEERVDFLASSAAAIWESLSSAAAPSPGSFAEALAPAVRGKHLLVSTRRPQEERLLARMGLTGAMPAVKGDFLGVVTQNASGNKIDWFLRRSVNYSARVDPTTGAITASLEVRLRNDAPAGGLPPIVINGSPNSPTKPGENRLYLSIYSPLDLEAASIDAAPVSLEHGNEFNRHVYSSFLTVPPGGEVNVRLSLTGVMPARGQYRLDVLRQPTVLPDDFSASISVPDGGTVRSEYGFRGLSRAVAAVRVPLATDLFFGATLEPGTRGHLVVGADGTLTLVEHFLATVPLRQGAACQPPSPAKWTGHPRLEPWRYRLWPSQRCAEFPIRGPPGAPGPFRCRKPRASW